MTVKELVAPGNEVWFVRCFDKQLWYTVLDSDRQPLGFEFPVPIDDIGNAVDKALLFMRYIRKHLAVIEEGRKQS